MEAIVITGKQSFEYRTDVPVPVPGPQEVRIKVLAAGICGTDIHITAGDDSVSKMMHPPFILGHEFCGEVDAWGAEVEGFSEGEFVSAEMHEVCYQCRACKDSKFHACQLTKLHGLHLDGAFAEYFVVPATNVVRLPRSIPTKVGAILDPLGNAVHATCITELAGKSVSIIGYGAIGAMGARVSLFCGAKQIFIVDVSEQALTRADEWRKRIAAEQVVTIIDAKKLDAAKEIIEASNGGTDLTVEFSGAQTGINTAFAATRSGGDVSLLGMPGETSVVIENYSRDFIWKGLTIHAIIGREMFRTWEKMISFLEQGLDVSDLITGEYRLKDFPTALARFKSGAEQKVVLYPGR